MMQNVKTHSANKRRKIFLCRNLNREKQQGGERENSLFFEGQSETQWRILLIKIFRSRLVRSSLVWFGPLSPPSFKDFQGYKYPEETQLLVLILRSLYLHDFLIRILLKFHGLLHLIVEIDMSGYPLPFITASIEIGESFGMWDILVLSQIQ